MNKLKPISCLLAIFTLSNTTGKINADANSLLAACNLSPEFYEDQSNQNNALELNNCSGYVDKNTLYLSFPKYPYLVKKYKTNGVLKGYYFNQSEFIENMIEELNKIETIKNVKNIPITLGLLNANRGSEKYFSTFETNVILFSIYRHALVCRIQGLDLSYNNIKRLPVGLRGLKKLHCLSLKGNYQLELEIPPEISRCCPNLEALDLSDTNLIYNICDLIPQLQKLQNLKTLCLIESPLKDSWSERGSPIKQETIIALLEQLPNLEKLILSCETIKTLSEELQKNPQIQKKCIESPGSLCSPYDSYCSPCCIFCYDSSCGHWCGTCCCSCCGNSPCDSSCSYENCPYSNCPYCNPCCNTSLIEHDNSSTLCKSENQ